MMFENLPIHPATGLRAIGIGKRGPIWPVMGAAEDPQGDPAPQGDPNPEPKPDEPKPDEPKPDELLGDGGKKALDAERAGRKAAEQLVKGLQEQLAAAKKDGLPEWQQQINDLKAQIDSEREARETAEKTAETERVAALRARLGKDLPDPIAALLTGTTEDEIKAQVDALTPHVAGGGPKPNPQQGNPSQGRGGTLSAGRERYAATQPK